MKKNVKTTEQPSHYRHLEMATVTELLQNMNTEDKTVPMAVEKVIPQIRPLIEAVVEKLKNNGRLFYIGAGTSGRLGVLDASECPPTFGVDKSLVTGVIAGGNEALTLPIENAEDDTEQGYLDLMQYNLSQKDIVIGLATSGSTPYVTQALKKCQHNGITTGSISCNQDSIISQYADFAIEVVVGPEFITGSTRLKGGTAQKLILNMISTITMIQLGRVEDNQMVNMQLTNEKLIERGTKMIMEDLGISDYDRAKALLLQHGSVARAIEHYKK